MHRQALLSSGLIAQQAPVLVRELIRLATKAKSEAVRVAASKEMFERGFGKATQPVEGSLTYGISEQLAALFKENAGNMLGRVALLCRPRTARSRTDMDGR